MSGRVFISSGQHDEGELDTANAIARQLKRSGFTPYVALVTQSLQDINGGILFELRRADYYVFIDFGREIIGDAEWRRGSLFANQELAIAAAMKIERAVYFREKGVKLEGFAKFMAANAKEFLNHERDGLPAAVEAEFMERGWDARYSRHLVPGQIHNECIDLRRSGRSVKSRFFFVDIHNHREFDAAYGAVARLAAVERRGETKQRAANRSPLKVSGQDRAFHQVIWPGDWGAFDLLRVDSHDGTRVFLNNALDTVQRPVLDGVEGRHLLHYQVVAAGFEVLDFAVVVHLGKRSEDADVRIYTVEG